MKHYHKAQLYTFEIYLLWRRWNVNKTKVTQVTAGQMRVSIPGLLIKIYHTTQSLFVVLTGI